MTTLRTIDVAALIEARDYHLREARRIDDAIAVAASIAKTQKKAARTMAKVLRKTTSERSTHPNAVHSRAQRAGAKAGRRPIDQVRRLFVEHGSKPLTLDDVLQRSGVSLLATRGRFGNTVSAEGATRRALGLVLSQLTKRREIRETKDGFVAAKLQTTDANGASA